MTLNRDDKAIAGEYVLGLLEGDAKAEAERRIASDADFAREIESWRMRLLAFDDTTAPSVVSDELWKKIEAGVPTRAVAAEPSAFAKFWSSLAVMRATAMGATFAALVLAVGLGFAVKAARQQPVMVAVLLDGSKPGAVVQAFSDGRVVLVPLVDMNVPEGRALEVWTLPSRERGPVSVGLMNRARTLTLSLKDLPAPGTDQLFEITLEPATGSPTGRPTGPILFKGNTALAL